MKNILIFILLVIAGNAYAARTSIVYIGDKYKTITCQQIAAAVGRTLTDYTLYIQNDDQRVTIFFEDKTAQEETDMDTLYVTDNSMTKQ